MQDPSQKTFQGDNFVRRAGDFDTFQALNLHSVAAMNRGQDISMMVGLLHTSSCFVTVELKLDIRHSVWFLACASGHPAALF